MLSISIVRKIVRLARDKRGVSAIEFALLAPVMIGLYFGCAEIATGVGTDRKVSLISAALANLSAQTTTISTADMTNILDASSAIISPYSSGNLKMTITCIKIDANKNAAVKWSVTRNGTANSGSITVPTALAVANSYLILSEASYAYTPTVGYTISGTLNLSDKMYMTPRISAPTYGTTTCT
ncbi:MAG TPA: TadE/TadG family type IV pilus assembly protein [Pseudolabrys sp.]|jgi:Flp pilus assembly protein TadG